MGSPPENKVRLPAAVRLARLVRHGTGLRGAERFWNMLRPAYRRTLALLSGTRGIRVHVDGLGTVRLPSSYLQEDVPAGEIAALTALLTHLRPEHAFYDVGASVGMYVFFALNRLGASGAIHAFEPDENSCRALLSHLSTVTPACPVRVNRTFVGDRSTGAPNLTAYRPSATRDAAGAATRHLYLFDSSDASLAPQCRLDDYVEAGQRAPDIVKCDIEGAELLFLRGAESVLRKHKPILIVSLHPDLLPKFGHRTEDVEAFLKDCGYSIQILNDDGEVHCLCRPSPSR